jgi:membrane associated rhomboid family serine protease
MTLYKSIRYILVIAAIFWLVMGFQLISHLDLSSFGIYPRTQDGLYGILAAPFLHANLEHLISNTVPFIVLGTAIAFFYRRIALLVMLFVYLGTGLAVWLLARSSYHIGASGVVYGFASFLFFAGVFRRDIKSLSIALIVVFLYGGLVYGILPLYKGVSWESHLFGAIMGGIAAYLFRNFKDTNENQQKSMPDFDDYKTGYRNIETNAYKYQHKK